MPLSESQRNQIAAYKIQIENLRKALNTIKENKKRKSEYYIRAIKNTKDENTKRSLRQSKIYDMNSLMSQIESKLRDIQRIKGYIQSMKR
jgi:GTP1/Obg family GTP-binding protein